MDSFAYSNGRGGQTITKGRDVIKTEVINGETFLYKNGKQIAKYMPSVNMTIIEGQGQRFGNVLMLLV